LGLLFIIALLKPVETIAQQTIKVIDIDTNEPVAIAIISTNNDSAKFVANIDGFVNFEVNNKFTYKFTRLGYKELKITGEQLSSNRIVMLESLPVELSPITITANAAWLDLNRAIDNTIKSMPKPPFYLKCFQQDKVEINNSTIVNAKAIYATKISMIFENGRGCGARSKLMGLNIFSNKNFKQDSIKNFSHYKIPFVNEFLVGHNKKDDNNVSFYYVDINDSILIIGYSPKQNYHPKNIILTSGRFVINKRGWRLIRIDSDINPRMQKYQNENVLNNSKKGNLYQNFNRSIYFSNNGLPIKLNVRLEYSLKNDKNKSTRAHTTSHVYKEMTEKDYLSVPLKSAKSKSIIYQKPFFNAEFDTEFKNGFTDK